MLNIKMIQMAVCKAYDITFADLVGKRRTAVLAEPRMIAMWLCSELLPDKSLPQIGRGFERDHTTILNGRKRGREITARSQFHIDTVNSIIKAIKARRDNEATLARRCN